MTLEAAMGAELSVFFSAPSDCRHRGQRAANWPSEAPTGAPARLRSARSALCPCWEISGQDLQAVFIRPDYVFLDHDLHFRHKPSVNLLDWFTSHGEFPLVKVLIQTPTCCYGDNALMRAPVDLL